MDGELNGFEVWICVDGVGAVLSRRRSGRWYVVGGLVCGGMEALTSIYTEVRRWAFGIRYLFTF